MVDVLVLWDALFADGPMLDLVDYIYISMLEAIRDRRTYLLPSTIFAGRSRPQVSCINFCMKTESFLSVVKKILVHALRFVNRFFFSIHNKTQ